MLAYRSFSFFIGIFPAQKLTCLSTSNRLFYRQMLILTTRFLKRNKIKIRWISGHGDQLSKQMSAMNMSGTPNAMMSQQNAMMQQKMMMSGWCCDSC